MSLKQSLIVALGLTIAPTFGCQERSNTVEQNQSKTVPGQEPAARPGVETNPHLPNPTHAGSGVPMGAPGVAPGTAGQESAGAAGAGDQDNRDASTGAGAAGTSTGAGATGTSTGAGATGTRTGAGATGTSTGAGASGAGTGAGAGSTPQR
jgi:hypothetical protein